MPTEQIISLPRGDYLVLREVDGRLYLDAASPLVGSLVALVFDAQAEDTLRVALEIRRARRRPPQPTEA